MKPGKTLPVKSAPAAAPALPAVNCKLGAPALIPGSSPVPTSDAGETFTVGTIKGLYCSTEGTMLTSHSELEFKNDDKSQPYAVQFLDKPAIITSPNQDNEIAQNFTSYKAGQHELTQITLNIDGKKYRVSPQKFQVQSVLPADQQGAQGAQQQEQRQQPTPFPIADPEKVPAPWWWWAIWLTILLVLIIFFVVQLRKWLKQREAMKKKAAEKPLTPRESFETRLRKLDSRGLHQRGEYKAFALELTSILKTAIGRAFGIAAEDMTSEELLSTLERRQSKFYAEAGAAVQAILNDLDQIKFAKIETTPERCMSLLDLTAKLGNAIFRDVTP